MADRVIGFFTANGAKIPIHEGENQEQALERHNAEHQEKDTHKQANNNLKKVMREKRSKSQEKTLEVINSNKTSAKLNIEETSENGEYRDNNDTKREQAVTEKMIKSRELSVKTTNGILEYEFSTLEAAHKFIKETDLYFKDNKNRINEDDINDLNRLISATMNLVRFLDGQKYSKGIMEVVKPPNDKLLLEKSSARNKKIGFTHAVAGHKNEYLNKSFLQAAQNIVKTARSHEIHLSDRKSKDGNDRYVIERPIPFTIKNVYRIILDFDKNGNVVYFNGFIGREKK